MGVTGNTSRCTSFRFNSFAASVVARGLSLPLTLPLSLPLALFMVVSAFSVFMSNEAGAQPKTPPVTVVQMQRLARYTMAKLEPDAAQVNPLASTISIHLPRESVKTVGDAVRYLLVRTGYRLADGLPTDVSDVLALSLPDVHRQLGPYTVTEALNVLLGATYSLEIDASRRVVAYRAVGAIGTDPVAMVSAVTSATPNTAASAATSVVASRELNADAPRPDNVPPRK